MKDYSDYNLGHEAGYDEGLCKGLADGKQKGYHEGYNDALKENKMKQEYEINRFVNKDGDGYNSLVLGQTVDDGTTVDKIEYFDSPPHVKVYFSDETYSLIFDIFSVSYRPVKREEG